MGEVEFAFPNPWPAWLSVTALGFLAVLGLAALFCWLILDQLRRDRATS
jgi:hypothetical protein